MRRRWFLHAVAALSGVVGGGDAKHRWLDLQRVRQAGKYRPRSKSPILDPGNRLACDTGTCSKLRLCQPG